MPQVEIDETELLALRRTSALLSKTLGDPKARETVLRGLKAANPDLPIPELDSKEPMLEALGEMNKSLADMKKQIADDKAAREDETNRSRMQAQWNEGRSKVQRSGYVGESLEALEKFMEEKGVADHEVAAAAFERLHPQPKPVVNQSGNFDFFNRNSQKNDENLKKLWETGDENAFLGPAIEEVLKQERGFAA